MDIVWNGDLYHCVLLVIKHDDFDNTGRILLISGT